MFGEEIIADREPARKLLISFLSKIGNICPQVISKLLNP
jgi:hypothetical protein